MYTPSNINGSRIVRAVHGCEHVTPDPDFEVGWKYPGGGPAPGPITSPWPVDRAAARQIARRIMTSTGPSPATKRAYSSTSP